MSTKEDGCRYEGAEASYIRLLPAKRFHCPQPRQYGLSPVSKDSGISTVVVKFECLYTVYLRANHLYPCYIRCRFLSSPTSQTIGTEMWSEQKRYPVRFSNLN